MDLWPLVDAVRTEARVGREWDRTIYRRLDAYLHIAGYQPEIEVSIPGDLVAEAVASVAHEVSVQAVHMRADAC